MRYPSKAAKSGYAYKTFDTRKEAKAFLESGKTRRQGPAIDNSISTVPQAVQLWLGICEKIGRDGREKVEPETFKEYRHRGRIMEEYEWPKPLQELDPSDIVHFRNWLLENKTRDQARRTLSSFHSVLIEMKHQGHLDRLFDGSTDRSRMGKVRRLWCGHLGLDYTDLKLVARVLAIAETPESLASLRERLDDRFAAVGMKRVPAAETCFLYDDLAAKLLAQRRVQFDRRSFRDMAEREGLLEPSGKRRHALAIGVRSFMHPIDPLENRCDRMLNLVPHFDGRYIGNQADWQNRILPELRAFALDAARSTGHLQIVIDAHASLAFALGALLNVKSGKRIEIEQRTGGRRFWSMDDQAPGPDWPTFEFEEEVLDAARHETALAISLTHDVSSAVGNFVKSQAPAVGRIIHCRPQRGASQQSVRAGAHAWMLAESAVQRVRALRDSGAGAGLLHVFIAGPNAFTFFLGQHQQALGPTAVYEWDFDGQRGGGYSLGLMVGEKTL